ncbi:MAG: hypothetical protein KDB14_06500 [Planctomycetales bacterium]|nr:hypothetical protein [Planctomycetales bacterium]
MQYQHTQTAPLYLILVAVGGALLVAAWQTHEVAPRLILVCTSLLLLLLFAASFRYLQVRDAGTDLLILFGPLPLFRRRICYAAMERVEQSRSTMLDGWGIHLSPSGGWTWNLWGFDCVDLWYRKGARLRKIRIGTDDPVGLASFLRESMSAQGRR